MPLEPLVPQFPASNESLLLGTAFQSAAQGQIDLADLDHDVIAKALFSVANQLEKIHPGIAEKHGWAQIADLAAFSKYLQLASAATLPEGLH